MKIELNSIELPDPLARALQRRAQARNVSVEDQIVRDLTIIELELQNLSKAELLELIRNDREKMAIEGVWLTEEFLAEAKAWGRN